VLRVSKWSLGITSAISLWLAACSVDSRQVALYEAPSQMASAGAGNLSAPPSAGEQTGGAGGVSGGADARSTPSGAAGAPAAGQYRLTVTRTGSGSGRVTSTPPGIDCGDTCSAAFDGQVVLRARSENGQNSFFAGWASADPACRGPKRDCLLDHELTLSADFEPMDHNLVFLSSKVYRADLGGLAAYDAQCNALASAAAINDLAGTSYVALMTDSAGSANPLGNVLDRVGLARGWLRMDGLPVGDEAASLVAPTRFYPPRFTEQGQLAGGGSTYLWTGLGTNDEGQCSGWTLASENSFVNTGLSDSLLWSGGGLNPCKGQELPIVCVGRSSNQPLTSVPSFQGKRVWLTSSSFVPGDGNPDDKCQSERPAGVERGVALIAYTNRPASAVIDPGATYVLPDGRLIGTGAQVLSGDMQVGVWLFADGSVPEMGGAVWSGAATLTETGTLESTCLDWTSGDPSLNGSSGFGGVAHIGGFALPLACSFAQQLFCVEP
jgi:hypothetical protein